MTRRSGGSYASRNGNNLERFVRHILDHEGYQDTGNGQGVFGAVSPCYGTQTPLGAGIYGNEHRADFLIRGALKFPQDLAIECKWQQSNGSVDEKFPYLVENIKISKIPTIILIDGGGYRPEARDWLKGRVGQAPFLAAVYSMAEMQREANRGLFAIR